MRPTHSVPPDVGSRRSLRCPPSHPLMALPSHPAQASAQMARPSGPSTHAATMGKVSPLLHQPGSTTYSPPTSTTMGGGYCPTAVPPMLSAPAISSYRPTAPFSDAITENSRPQNSWAEISQKMAQIEAVLARTSMEPLSNFPPPPHCGGSTTPSSCDLPSAQASPTDRLAKGSMEPSPAITEAATPSPSLAHPSTPARSYPSHPHRTMGGIPEGLMAPSPATTEAATPSPSSACPFLPTRSSPTHPLPKMGGSATSAACRAKKHNQRRLAFAIHGPGFADANPWVMATINTVALSSNVGINDTPSVDTWHSKPGGASPPQLGAPLKNFPPQNQKNS
jgi:hypothetical protein